MKLNSKKYPNIEYEKGEGIFLSPDETTTSFYLDIEDELTANEAAMAVVASMLDEADTLIKTAKDFLKKVLSDEDNEYYETIASFMKFHRDDIDSDTVAKLFPVNTPSAISFSEMIDYLELNRFGSLIDAESDQPVFVMDLSFNPNVTDELIVIYFDLEKEIYSIEHES